MVTIGYYWWILVNISVDIGYMDCTKKSENMTCVFATEPLFSPRICAFVQAKDFSSCEALENPRDAMDGLHMFWLFI